MFSHTANNLQYSFSDISQKESEKAAASMDGLIEDLGVAALPDASLATRQVCSIRSCDQMLQC